MKNESRTQNAPYARACVEEIAPAIMNPGEWQSITFPWLPRNLQNNWNTVGMMSRRQSLHSKFTKLSTDKNKIMLHSECECPGNGKGWRCWSLSFFRQCQCRSQAWGQVTAIPPLCFPRPRSHTHAQKKTSPTGGGSSQHLRRLGLRQQLLQGNEAGLARVRAGHADLVRKGHCVAADHRWDVLLLVVDVLKNLHQDRPKQAL